MTKFKKITAIFAIICLCTSGIFSKAQTRMPKTLDGKENRFTRSDEEMWSPCQDFRAGIAVEEWWLDNTGEIFTDNLFYYKRVKLCFPAEARTISIVNTPEKSGRANIIVEPYLIPDFKQYPPGLSPSIFITPVADLLKR